jgi:hypothetical protein
MLRENPVVVVQHGPHLMNPLGAGQCGPPYFPDSDAAKPLHPVFIEPIAPRGCRDVFTELASAFAIPLDVETGDAIVRCGCDFEKQRVKLSFDALEELLVELASANHHCGAALLCAQHHVGVPRSAPLQILIDLVQD